MKENACTHQIHDVIIIMFGFFQASAFDLFSIIQCAPKDDI